MLAIGLGLARMIYAPMGGATALPLLATANLRIMPAIEGMALMLKWPVQLEHLSRIIWFSSFTTASKALTWTPKRWENIYELCLCSCICSSMRAISGHNTHFWIGRPHFQFRQCTKDLSLAIITQRLINVLCNQINIGNISHLGEHTHMIIDFYLTQDYDIACCSTK